MEYESWNHGPEEPIWRAMQIIFCTLVAKWWQNGGKMVAIERTMNLNSVDKVFRGCTQSVSILNWSGENWPI